MVDPTIGKLFVSDVSRARDASAIDDISLECRQIKQTSCIVKRRRGEGRPVAYPYMHDFKIYSMYVTKLMQML
jgi:hypothetical protein